MKRAGSGNSSPATQRGPRGVAARSTGKPSQWPTEEAHARTTHLQKRAHTLTISTTPCYTVPSVSTFAQNTLRNTVFAMTGSPLRPRAPARLRRAPHGHAGLQRPPSTRLWSRSRHPDLRAAVEIGSTSNCALISPTHVDGESTLRRDWSGGPTW